MAQDREALLKHFKESREVFMAAIDGLTPEQMMDPSIDGWSVKDHMLHIAAWDDIRAAEVTRIAAGFESAWRMTEAQDEAFNTMSYELRRALSYDQAVWEIVESRIRLLAAIRDASNRGLDETLYGEAGLVSNHELEHAGWIRDWRSEAGDLDSPTVRRSAAARRAASSRSGRSHTALAACRCASAGRWRRGGSGRRGRWRPAGSRR